MEVEHCLRGDGEEIRIFLHRTKKIVDKVWPDDMEGIAEVDRAAERQAQGRQRRQRYMDYTLRGLRPRYLKRKVQEYLMERPNATWNDFSTRIIQRDMSYPVSSNFLNDEEQTKVQLASLGQKLKNLRSELYRNIESTRLRTQDNPILIKMADTTLQGFATIAASTDTLKIGVAEECETKKNDESNMICPSKGMLLLYGTAALATLTVNPNTVKTGTDLRIGLMVTIQPMDFSLLKEKPGKMEVTS